MLPKWINLLILTDSEQEEERRLGNKCIIPSTKSIHNLDIRLTDLALSSVGRDLRSHYRGVLGPLPAHRKPHRHFFERLCAPDSA